MMYVGIDWATEVHLVALVDETGTVVDEWEMDHSRPGVDQLVARLAKAGGPQGMRIALESGAPLLVDQLVAVGYEIYLINPKQGDRFRDRHSPAGCKDDRRDARAFADAVRTDVRSLLRVVPDSPATQELLRRVRARTRLVEARVRAGQQLREALARYFPALLALKRKMHDALLLSLLEAYPTPVKARRAQRTRLTRLLQEHRIRSLDADQLRDLFQAPALAAPEAVAIACRDEALDLAARIRLLNTQLDRAEKRIDALFAQHPDRELVLGVPGIGAHLGPDILAEIGDDPRRRTQPDVLTVYSGVAPVTRSSGTRRQRRKNGQRAPTHVAMRRGCNRRLQTLLWLAARNSVARSDWARAYVRHRLAQGHAYNSVIRALAYKWTKVLAQILATRVPYDEELHLRDLVRNDTPWALNLDSKTEAEEAA